MAVTKVDERSVVPPLDGAARARLSAALDQPGVVSALLFGSQATGVAGPLSDVDVGIWVDPGLAAIERDRLRRRVTAAASEALGTEELQVVVLNDASPLLRHRAVRDGLRLIDRDARSRVRLETGSLLEYLDTAPLRETLARGFVGGSWRADLVDVESIANRLERLERLIELLVEVRSGGQAAYLADERLRAATERWLQLAAQACIDVGAQLVSELSAPPPADYAGIFRSLAEAGHLDGELAKRLVAMARQRNLLVHAYLDVDDAIVFASLEHLDDLRAFAAAVERLLAAQ